MGPHLLARIKSRNVDSSDAESAKAVDLSRSSTRQSLTEDALLLNNKLNQIRRGSVPTDGTPNKRRTSAIVTQNADADTSHDSDAKVDSSPSAPVMGEGSLSLDSFLTSPADSVASTSASTVPELLVQAASPQESSGPSFQSLAAPMMTRRLSDQSDVSEKEAVNRNRSSSFAGVVHASDRPRSSSFRRLPASASNSPAKLRMKAHSASSGIASAIAMSGAALTAQSLVLDPSHFRPSPPNSAGRSRTGSLENDFESEYGMESRMTSIESAVDLGNFDDLVGTGYAVASRKRNEEFHLMFEDVGEDDYLIEDYGCALQKEILVQGRLYISEHHLCFNANIFGWVTHLVIPFAEVVSIKKRTTAIIIPNAIEVATMHARYSFASFLSRDTTYELIVNIWRLSHPTIPAAALPDHGGVNSDDSAADEEATEPTTRKRITLARRKGSSSNKRERATQPTEETIVLGHSHGQPLDHRKKVDAHRETGIPASIKQYANVALDEVFTGSPEKIYNLMFVSQAFMKEFWANNQKLTEIQLNDWSASSGERLTRSFSYIKPLNGSVGPKQMKCFITDQNEVVDFDESVVVLTVTKTPDAPSGDSFSTMTKTCITWAKNNCCRVRVTTEVEWTAKSWLKSVITSSAIEGQKQYHKDLAKEMKAYISKHRSEFQHDQGGDEIQDEVVQEGTEASSANEMAIDAPQKPLTFMDRLEPITTILSTLLDMLTGLFDSVLQMSKSQQLTAAAILLLVFLNLWTLGFFHTPTSGNQTQLRKSPDEVAQAVRGVLEEYFEKSIETARPVIATPPDERENIMESLRELEERVARLKGRLDSL